ncbi:MAG: bifunctional hydroxymethylpyrimidine kinase/phosphomethylpyrimidine kinase [Xanthomonadaceae bacterium]|nr:bifunctional hydroxymethylpyrimidine kinase/phosphomethylpyrimidine kinase [Xanthomonadaceae bacterium]
MPTASARIRSVLTIAGSDSGGGAGIQADLKTFAAHRVHGLSAIAALTAQHTRGVTAVHVPPVEFLRAQIDACFDDFDIRAVKFGMLATHDVIWAAADTVAMHRAPKYVLDPVMIATSGAKLLADDALYALRERLLPMTDIITPNLPEAELLLGKSIDDLDAMRSACVELLNLGVWAVLLKGGHLASGDEVTDLFAMRDDAGLTVREIRHPRLAVNAHGTGCTLAAAIAAHLAQGANMQDACVAASDYIHRALLSGYRPGRSDVLVLDHFGAASAT